MQRFEENIMGRRSARTLALAALLGGMALSAQAWEKGKLTIWINADKGYNGLQKVADEYTKKTGVPVKVEHFDNAVGKFEEAMNAGNGPDIWVWPHDRLGDWIKRGWVAPITPDQALRQDIVQVAWDGFTQGGKTWGYPLSVEAIALVYNKDLVPEPPKTFEEIIPLHRKLKTQGKRAIGWETASPYFTWPLLSAGGAYVFQRKIDGSYDPRDTGINHAGAVRGGEFIVQLMKTGVIPEGGMSYQEAEEGMTSGKQAMWITGPWAWESLTKAKINYGVALLPTLNGKPARPFVGVLGAMVTQPSPNKAQATAFLEQYLLKSSGLAEMNRDKPLGVPASKTMFWTLYSDPRIRTSMDSIYAGRPMPSNNEMTLFWQHFTTALKEIEENNRPPREALDAAAVQIRGTPVKVAATVKGKPNSQ
jgi:maltose/maltodextrin transport system substrate-binding protein